MAWLSSCYNMPPQHTSRGLLLVLNTLADFQLAGGVELAALVGAGRNCITNRLAAPQTCQIMWHLKHSPPRTMPSPASQQQEVLLLEAEEQTRSVAVKLLQQVATAHRAPSCC